MNTRGSSHFRQHHIWLLLALFAFASPTQARDELSATYTATLVEGEFKGLDQVDGEKLTGIWLIQFLPGEAFQMLLNGEVMIDGFWSLSDGQISLSDMSGPLLCDEDEAGSATYQVQFRGFSITMETEVDPCPERSAVLSQGSFRTVLQ